MATGVQFPLDDDARAQIVRLQESQINYVQLVRCSVLMCWTAALIASSAPQHTNGGREAGSRGHGGCACGERADP